MNRAAKLYGIPVATLHMHVHHTACIYSHETSRGENHCQLCGKEFQDGEEELCSGCDECWRWVHRTCAGLTTPPDTDEEWLCHLCE